MGSAGSTLSGSDQSYGSVRSSHPFEQEASSTIELRLLLFRMCNTQGFFVIPQPHKFRMSQVFVGLPFSKFYLRHEFRPEPSAFSLSPFLRRQIRRLLSGRVTKDQVSISKPLN